MQILGYMATVSKDADKEPWYGQGHEAIAQFALGRREPITDSDLKAVQRALKPLFEAKAIALERRGAFRRNAPSTARYGLNLELPLPVDIAEMERQPDE
ncbi:hypothetical protein [Kribbella catacumbae]|uniref:hypothetical protein n=1 Tax=Kribbella catacumbae TaxID=460086 RepID=UPI0012FC1DE0|nr:hypothetical protein [Kribbella catacumbae]